MQKGNGPMNQEGTHYDNTVLERFIPIDYDEIVQLLCDGVAPEGLAEFSALLREHYHKSFHRLLLNARADYLPFDPDSDYVTRRRCTEEESGRMQERFLGDAAALANYANFEELTREALNAAVNETSPYGVEVNVDLEAFGSMRLFFRGSSLRREHKRTVRSLYLKKELVTTPIYRRLLMLFRLKGESRIYLKLFKEIPASDLEMLFPNTRVKISMVDKIKLAITGGGGTIGGAMTLVGKLAASLEPVALLGALGAFGAILWRQVSAVFSHRVKYMARLAQNLYFYNLDNNAGVLSHLVSMAEAEECKEALLAYAFLARSEAGMTIQELDAAIEAWVGRLFGVPIDFEIGDAVAKLESLELVSGRNGCLAAAGTEEALRRLRTV
jgi:hypothetical protein